MMAGRKFDLPCTIFSGDDDEEEAASGMRARDPDPTPTPLEKFLKRKRDPETGKLTPKKRAPRSRSIASSTFDRTMLETQDMIRTGEWEDAAVRHLVALFTIMHTRCYGIAPTLSGSELYLLTGFVAGFVKRAFAGDMRKTLEYLRWVWTREMSTEKWRRENHREAGRRLTLRIIVSNSLLDDYRVAMARRR